MATAAWSRFSSFSDILYGVVLGFGFTLFPDSPREAPLQTTFFLWTLGITAQDWYQFHSLFGPALARGEEAQRLGRWQFFTQLAALLALYQMFVHTADGTPVAWLIWATIFLAASGWWNFITPYDAHLVYVAIDVVLAVVLLALVASYHSLSDRLLGESVDWFVLGVTVALAVVSFGVVGPAWERRLARDAATA